MQRDRSASSSSHDQNRVVLRLVLVCVGVMCVLQGTLNIVLRLYFTPQMFSASVNTQTPSGPGAPAKTLLFPEVSNTSYVKLTPLKPLLLEAFTLCMSLSVDTKTVNQLGRETVLFAYRSRFYDELNVWKERGLLTLYLSSSEYAAVSLPSLSSFPTHLCLSWESSTGLTAFWVEGNRSVLQIYRKNHKVQPGGTIILGQDPDSLLGDFDHRQSFVGEITDVNMWDYVLTGSQIKQLAQNKWTDTTANVLNWKTVKYEINGNVLEVEK